MRIFLTCIFLFFLSALVAQSQLREIETSLQPWAVQLVYDTLSDGRRQASEQLFEGLQRALNQPGAFAYPFDSLQKYISILKPADNTFRVITWQLRVNDSTWHYSGFLQVDKPRSALYVLNDYQNELPYRPLQERLSPDRWYGALYYNLYAFNAASGRCYLLFGYDGHALSERRKLIDVLWFDPKTGAPNFGAPVFNTSPEGKGPLTNRHIIEYYAEAIVRLNWDEQYQLILFDNLISIASPYNGLPTLVPDGSYQGFKLENGVWMLVDKVFNDTQDEAPRPFPVLDQDKNKDILGREKKRKN